MALMMPDSIPSKASKGEETLYEVLRDRLPNDYLIWYEPRVNGLYPDFIILSPAFGLLIIEVKGWYAGQIERANNNFFDIRQKYKEQIKVETQASPLR